MSFNSLQFAVFFLVVTTLYFALPQKCRWLLLLISSCYFYMAFVPIYILILGFTIAIDFAAGILIENASGRRRWLFLLCSLAANIAVLALFKYYTFIAESLTAALYPLGIRPLPPTLSMLLPIGLSFHTFQAMSYTIEVYLGRQRAERHLGIYALYVMFYPQLVAGPIERPQNLLPQFRVEHAFDYDRVTSGMRLMLWGLFKKVVIADRLAIVVDKVYGNPTHFNSSSLIIATFFFAFQIFCDFSAYSDMAIGAARVMGFRLMANFDRPYHSLNIQEFWRRWHISLSTWFKDYVYIPLGGSRTSTARWCLSIVMVFLLSGLWHGGNWTFVIWGALHGVYLLIFLATARYRAMLNNRLGLNKAPILKIAMTFLFVDFAWIFFRANNVQSALYIAKQCVVGFPDFVRGLLNHESVVRQLGLSQRDMAISVTLICFLELVHYLQGQRTFQWDFSASPIYVRWLCYLSGVFSILQFGVFENRQFIYFQF